MWRYGSRLEPGHGIVAETVGGERPKKTKEEEMTMAEITGGQALARCLAREGVRFVFGLPCPEIDPFLAALEENEIRFVSVRHESGAVHMAEGLYKTTGQVAAVLGNPGPGSANLLPGLITALHEGVPVLAITSQHRSGVVYPSSPATFQGQDQLQVFASAVKYGAPIFDRNRIAEVTRLAFREMWTGRPGPVQLEIPGPVLYDTFDDGELVLIDPAHYRVGPTLPNESQLEEAADLLANASRPAVVAGAGVDRADANAALEHLVEQLGCPVLTSMAGRSVFPRDHDQFVFGFGAAGDLVRKEADVVLVVGTRLGNLDLPFDKYWGDPNSQKLIQIDIDSRHIGVSRPIALGILADARAALEGLVQIFEARGIQRERSGDLTRYRKVESDAREVWEKSVADWSGEGVHPAHVMQAVGKVFGREAIYTVDGGNTSLWGAFTLPATGPRSYHNILELGMLGTGIPSAIGAKLSSPEREVVCVTGDGAAGFNFMEMQSAVRDGIAITTVVCADGSWTMEVPNEMARYGRTFGTETGEIRWDRVAEGLGCVGFFVDRAEDLEPVLEKARASNRPAVVCVRTNRDANLSLPAEAMGRFFEVYNGPM
jgi:acetolactate synthase-1/2/3 large subunit